MTIADCKRGRKKFKLDPRYSRHMRKDAASRAKRLQRLIEKEKLMKARKGKSKGR